MPSAPSPDRSSRRRCPGCGAPPVPAYAPFCGRGCRDRDLIAWFGENHRIAGRAADPADEES